MSNQSSSAAFDALERLLDEEYGNLQSGDISDLKAIESLRQEIFQRANTLYNGIRMQRVLRKAKRTRMHCARVGWDLLHNCANSYYVLMDREDIAVPPRVPTQEHRHLRNILGTWSKPLHTL